jgi:excisionase family DNA binding protein
MGRDVRWHPRRLEVVNLHTNEWMSTEAASAYIGVTPRTLYRFIDEGQLRAYRFGRVIRLKTADVDEYIERCLIKPGELAHLTHWPVSA